MFLESYLTTIPRPDARPEKVADLGFRVGTKVTIPYLDSRTCSGIQLDMHEDIVRDLFVYDDDGVAIRDKTLGLALKVYYRGTPQFHGALSAPKYDFGTGKIELVAHDPSLRLKRAFLMAATSITLDGEGLLSLLDLAQNSDAEDLLNWPSLGIVRGVDLTTGSLVTTRIDKGSNIWQTFTDAAQSMTEPDFELEPVETDPSELASGTEFANYFTTAAEIDDSATTEFDLVVSLPGAIGGLRLGIWAEHTAPRQINIELVHPDGTAVRVYTGANEEEAGPGDGSFLGAGPGECFFGHGSYPYDQAYPHVGTFRPDSPLGVFYGKVAVGTWKLRVIDVAGGDTGLVNQFRLDFQLPAPAYCRMNVSDKPDTSDPDAIAPTAVFHKGHGTDNARILNVTPQGDQVRNKFTATSKAGTKTRRDNDSRADYGTYAGYDSPGDGHSLAYLTAWADANIGAYGRPIPALELAPIDDGGVNEALRYGEDIFVGRHVRAIGKRGHAYFDVLGRVTQAVLTQQKSSVQCDLDVQPVAGGDIADE